MKIKVNKANLSALVLILGISSINICSGQSGQQNDSHSILLTQAQVDSIKKVTVARVNADWANLNKYAGENKILPEVTNGERRVVFMGNSITEAWKIVDRNFFSENKSFIDRGISGQTTPQMLLRFRDDVINLNPSVVVILAGTNDIAGNTGPTTIEEIFGNIVSMIELARANSIKVVLCSVLPAYDYPWRPGLEPAGKIMKLNSMLKAYAEKNGIVYTDFFTPMADQRNGLKSEYSKDGVHPNLPGYKVMDDLVVKAIDKTIKLK